MKWIGQNIYDNVALFRNNIRVGGGNIYGGDGSSNNWIMIDCQDGNDTSGGGITFHEATLAADTAVDFDTPQYGAKIVYNEDDDDFSLGTIDNSDYKKQIVMNRGSTAVDFAGNITTAGTTNTFSSATSLKPVIKIKNTTNDANASSLNFIKDKGAAGADGDDIGTILWTGDNSAQEQTNFASIVAEVSEADDTDEAGKLTFNVAASDGSVSYLSPGLILEGEHGTAGEVDVTVGHRVGSTTTIAGTLTMGTTATLTNAGLLSVANQSNITGLGTISSGTWQGTAIATAYIADDAVTFAKASGVTPNVYGSVIKLIPSDFMANDHGGNTKFGVGYDEGGGGSGDTSYGMRVANNATELYAFVSIPEGMKATHVDIYDKNDLAVEVFENQINETTRTSKGSGNANTTIDITDVNSTATNFLSIVVTTTSATNDKVWGGKVTIAVQ